MPYYDLFNKYRSDYQVDKILAGKADDAIKNRARAAKFDERLSLLGLLLDGITEHLRNVCRTEAAALQLMETMKSMRLELAKPGADLSELLAKQVVNKQNALTSGRRASSMSREDQFTYENVIAILEEQRGALAKERPADAKAAFEIIKGDFDKRTKALKKAAADAGKKLSNLFVFCEEVFREGQEVLILVTELTLSPDCARFISR